MFQFRKKANQSETQGPTSMHPVIQLDDKELIRRFKHHKPTENAARAHHKIRDICLDAAWDISVTVPQCPETTLSIRKLEEAMFWANAAIARNHEYFEDREIDNA